MVPESSIMFCLAEKQDAPIIAETTRYYYNRFSDAQGFLAGYRSVEQVQADLQHYYVARIKGEPAGHVLIEFGLPEEFDLLKWHDTSEACRIRSFSQVVSIVHIAVRKEFLNQGIGTFLYNGLFARYPAAAFISSVIVKPYCNAHSLRFHEKCGFLAVAYHDRDVIHGTVFESVYFVRYPEVNLFRKDD